jgi:hypothetical protein
VRNTHCARTSRWPFLDPEASFDGAIVLQPRHGPLAANAVWTDGSVGVAGGAAAWQPISAAHFTSHVALPYSSTQCEFIALSLAAKFPVRPSVLLTDSLASLQLIQTWGRRSAREILSCPVRAEVRLFLAQWQHAVPPTLAKVKAHDRAAAEAGDARPACGIERADALAKAAADDSTATVEPYVSDPRYADAVRVRDANGGWVSDLGPAIVAGSWWTSTLAAAGGQRRTWLAQLYPTLLASI